MDPLRHPADELQLLLDRQLSSDRRAEVEAHLASCPHCQRELDALRRVKRVLRVDLPEHPVPSEVAARVSAALAAESSARVTRRSPAARLWRWAAVAGLSLGAAAAVFLIVVARGARSDPVGAVAHDFASYRAATLSFQLETPEPPTLERFFGSRMPFPTRVFDFGMMGFRLAGGKVHRLAGRQSALFAYENASGQRVLCQMYQGRLSELPPGAEEREHDGVRFRIYLTAGSTLVFWQEGSVVCVLATDGDLEAAVLLAYAKAIKT